MWESKVTTIPRPEGARAYVDQALAEMDAGVSLPRIASPSICERTRRTPSRVPRSGGSGRSSKHGSRKIERRGDLRPPAK
jgi:hypothetical protein